MQTLLLLPMWGIVDCGQVSTIISTMPETSTPKAFFGRNASVLLDIIRFSAALVVANIHITRFSPAWHPLPESAGNMAVCVFFVLSGFVIRFITTARVTTARDYWIDRASRIYSVTIPALILTVIFEGIAVSVHPAAFYHFADPYRWIDVPRQLLASMTFTTGLWGYGMPPLSNAPFWSLTFEVIYYILYGVIHYTKTARWLLVPLILLISGPSIALLFPVWLFGVLLYDVYRWLHGQRAAVPIAGIILAASAIILAALRHPILHLIAVTSVRQRQLVQEQIVNALPFKDQILNLGPVAWLDRLSPSFYLVGGLLSVVLLFTMTVLDRHIPALPKTAASRIRFVADSTFTLYLLHRPFFVLVYSLMGRSPNGKVIPVLLLVIITVISVALAVPLDRLKNTMRTGLRRGFIPSTVESVT